MLNMFGNYNDNDNNNNKQPPVYKYIPKIVAACVSVSEFVGSLAEKKCQNSFAQVVTLEDCLSFYKEEDSKLQKKGITSTGFIISVTRNMEPRNDNDKYIVVQGLVNAQNKSVVVNGETVSRVIHTRTIDDALIKALNNKDSVFIRKK